MTSHSFKVGQTVRLSQKTVGPGVAGVYKILALLPEEHGDCQYRVQSTVSSQQRVVQESQLSRL
ncbi:MULTISPECIES: hypothetical protein [Afifella]|uniref:Uncharacterized protein n=1 Tax=Afifella marina DSM 2698 TaxID=1120955 RepID=A0A1G5M2S6_AFIMA|nr:MULTISPECIES: hypothetical protein [Afifella]MBK1623058.1 hypothetical protein [Afifella marina DSM 2698]MBK1626052.1 hypothetical protein [Afifella marina]MBK5917876.1 hypothetical protein [Afifella marina]MCF1504809.1 hypothetical protein [Afifella sp. H1R]MCT8269021.1 hypothetical protein [Afifella sp. JA880]